MLQPKPLWAPATWGCFFITVHSVQIARILRANADITMSKEEEALYEQAFHPHGFTPRTFLAVLQASNGRRVTFGSGETITVDGEDAKSLVLVTGGSGALLVRDSAASSPAVRGALSATPRRRDTVSDGVLARIEQSMLRHTTGFWVGECCDLRTTRGDDSAQPDARHREPERTKAPTLVAIDGTIEAVCFDAARFHEAVHAAGPAAKAAAEHMQIAALRTEVCAFRKHGQPVRTRTLAARARIL